MKRNLYLALIAFISIVVLLPAVAARAGIDQWTTSGPFGGPVNVVAVSPNYANDVTAFIGLLEGRVYKTTDGGNSWVPAYSGIVSPNGIQCLAISPNYSANQTLFAGIGTGGGVFKSTNGGTTWAAVNTGIPLNTDVRALALSANTVFAGTNGGVYKSTNAGTSWTAVNTGIPSTYPDNKNIYSLAISPNYASDQTVIAGSYFGDVYKTTDGGTNWSRVVTGYAYSMPIYSLAISPIYPSDQTVYVGKPNGVFKSADGALTWSKIDSGVNGVFSVATAPDYATSKTIYVAYYNSSSPGTFPVYRVDNDTSWTNISSGVSVKPVKAFATSSVYAADYTIFAVSSGGAYQSTNRGASWAEVNAGIVNADIRALAVFSSYASDHTVIAGSNGLGVLKSADGGVSWAAINNGIPFSYDGAKIVALAVSPDSTSDRTIFAAPWGRGVFKTVDGGANWTEVSTGLTSSDFHIWSLAISPDYTSDHTVFAGLNTPGAKILRTVNGGDSWTQVFVPTSTVMGFAVSPNFGTDRTVFAATYFNGVYKSTDGGTSWTPANSGLAGPSLYMYSLAISPNFAIDQTVYAGSLYSGIFKSTDGGSSWSNVLGIASSSIVSLAISPEYATDQTVIAGTGNLTNSADAVLRSTDGGLTWSKMHSGLPDERLGRINPTVVITRNDRNGLEFFAGSKGFGVFGYTNHDLVAANDSYSVTEDAVLTVLAPGVLANDSDAVGHPLTAILVSGPSRGMATLNSDGSFTYTPNANYKGLDSFNYRAHDGLAASNIATVAITITPKVPVITWANPADIVYGTALGSGQLNATADVDGAFTYLPPAGTVLNAGFGQTLSVILTPADAVNYETVSASVDINVLKKDQAISFGPLEAKTYGDPDFTVSATADSGLLVSFSAAGSCTVLGDTVHIVGAGTCTVTARQGGDANHSAAADVSPGFTVNKAMPTLTWANPADIVYGTTLSDAQLNATANVSGAFTYVPPAGTVLNAGPGQTLSVTFTPADAMNYETAAGSVLISVFKKDQTISFGPLANKTYGDADFTVSATADSGLPVSFSAAGSCTVSGSTVHLTGVGTCTVTAHQPGNTNYNAAPDLPRGFTVLAAAPDLVVTSITNPPASIKRGGKFPVTDVTGNIGKATSGKSSTTRYYLSNARAKNAGSKLLTGTRSVSALAPGATSGGTINVTVPTSTTTGTYYLLACADDTNVVSESNESNNCLASTSTIIVK